MIKQEIEQVASTNVGISAENFFREWLELRSWHILAYNWRPKLKGAGQVDVIASKEQIVLFEIKYRNYINELYWPLSRRQLLRLYKASCVWNLQNQQVKITEHCLALICPNNEHNIRNYLALDKHIYSYSTSYKGYLIKLLRFNDILD